MRHCFDTWSLLHTNHMLNNEMVSQLAWVTRCLDRIQCELWWSVIGGSDAFVLPNRSLIAGCVCVKGWGMKQHLSLIMGMVIGLALVWEKLYTPTGLLIYCNSRALGHWACLWKIELAITCSLYICNCIGAWYRNIRSHVFCLLTW